MNTTTMGAEEWFWITKQEANEILSQNQIWPFQNATIDQLYALVNTLTIKRLVQSILRIIGGAIPALGVVFSLLLICTFWRKSLVEKNTFYSAMLMVAILDLCFNILDMTFNICYRKWKISGFTNYGAMWMVAYCRGLAYVFSLASDMTAFCITVERYLAIGKPQFYRNLSKKIKRRTWISVLILIILISSTRMHYTMALQVEEAGPIYVFTQSDFGATSFVVNLAMFNDVIVPIILVCLVLILSTKFRMVVIKRQKVKVIQVKAFTTINGREQQKEPKMENNFSRSIVKLTMALDALLILNNFSYILYFVSELWVVKNLITYASSYEDLVSYCSAQTFEGYAGLVAVIMECFTRAINFPVYITLSGTMTKEFRDFWKRIFKI